MKEAVPTMNSREAGTPSRYCCFDVFDTVLTRAVGNPDHLFLLLGRRLLLSGQIRCSAEQFARQRIHAEERAARIKASHPTLEQIYQEVVGSLGAPPEDLSLLVRAEMTMERELSRAIPQAQSLIQDARLAGEQIVFVSDTNMPSAFLRQLLSSKGLWEPGDIIFASCECGFDKARGLLFTHVARTLGAKTRVFRHNGNDAVSDVRNGRLSGWKVQHLTSGNLNRYEQALAAESYATGGMSSLLAGAARLARLAASNEERHTIKAVAAGVAAPCLVAWVLWIMRQAVRDGCRRLYFVSRDGEVLLQIAHRLETVLETGLDLRYLYTSRRTLQRCGPLEIAMQDLLRPQSCSMNDVAEFFALEVDALIRMLPEHLRNTSQWDLDLTSAARKEVFMLLEDNGARSILSRKSSEARKLYFDYLSQEGWADGTVFGLVDTGWRGSTAGTLGTLLPGTPINSPHRYYFFGLGADAYRVAGPNNIGKLKAWFYDASAGAGYLPELPSTCTLVEMFCAGEHGAVNGFQRQLDRIEPVLASKTSPMQDWGLASIRESIHMFTDSFVETLHSTVDLIDIDADARRQVDGALKLFWLHPTTAEVRDWGTFPVDRSLNNGSIMPLAERVGILELATALRQRKFSFRPMHGWAQGTAVQSSLPFRVLLAVAWRVRSEIPRFRRRVHWLKGRLNLKTSDSCLLNHSSQVLE